MLGVRRPRILASDLPRWATFGVPLPRFPASGLPRRRWASVKIARGWRPINMFPGRGVAFGFVNCAPFQRLSLSDGGRRIDRLCNTRLIERAWGSGIAALLSDRSANNSTIGATNADVLCNSGSHQNGQQDQRYQSGLNGTHGKPQAKTIAVNYIRL